jgi:uncharacterized membrane protein YhaH (DUF805 family)
MDGPQNSVDDSEPPEDPIEKVVRIALGEPLLWPVALTGLLMLTTFGAWILVFALRVRGLLAGAILLLLIFLTVYGIDADVRARRLGPRNRLVLLLWAGSIVEAIALDALGVFRVA